MPLSEYSGGGKLYKPKLNTMKKLLLTFIITLISGIAFAQDQDSVKGYRVYNIEHATKWAKQDGAPGIISSYKGRRVYYDYRAHQYLLEEDFVRKYGSETRKTLDKLWLKAQLYEEPLTKGESWAPKKVKSADQKLSRGTGKDALGQFSWKMDPRHITIGASLIGASAAAYMLTNSIASAKAKSIQEELATSNNGSDTLTKELESWEKTKRTVGYISAGVSVAGVIVVLTGLHKEYANGIKLAHNLTISDYGAGISLTKRF